MDAVDGDVAEARLGAANLNVLALAFVTLERNAGHTTDCVGDIGVGKALDYFRGQHLENVVRRELAVQGLDFSAFAARIDGYFLLCILDLEGGVHG